MNFQDNNNHNLEASLEYDATGMEELQNVVNEIEKLKNSDEEISNDDISEDEIESNIDIENDQVEVKKPDVEKRSDETQKLKKDKYRALAAKAEAEKRVRELEDLLNESLNANTYHYGKSAYNDLERAKSYKRTAIENGDMEALIEADEVLYKAMHAVNELEKFSNQQKQEPRYREEETQPYGDVYNEIAQDWLESHPELEPQSRNYNADLAVEVGKFVNKLDNDLKRNNKMDLFFSQDYFETINEYIDTIKSEGSSKPVRANRSSSLNSHVGGVRNSYNSGGSIKSSTQMTLSADEKRMAANAGLSEKEWVKYKLEDIKTGKRA